MKTNRLFMAFFSFFLFAQSYSLSSRECPDQQFSSPQEGAIVLLNTPANGIYCFRVTASGENVEEAILEGQRQSVQACLFPNKNSGLKIKSICAAGTRDKHGAYFDYFLEGEGNYLNFVRITPDGFPLEDERRKTKDGYEVIIKVEVFYNNLRTEMQNEGIID